MRKIKREAEGRGRKGENGDRPRRPTVNHEASFLCRCSAQSPCSRATTD